MEDYGVHLAFANTPGDDLCVLGSEIKNDYLFVHAAEKNDIEAEFLSALREKTWPSGNDYRKFQPNSGISLPSRTIMTGRPVGVWYSFVWSIPREW